MWLHQGNPVSGHMKTLHTLTGTGSAALVAAVPYPCKVTQISHNGRWSAISFYTMDYVKDCVIQRQYQNNENYKLCPWQLEKQNDLEHIFSLTKVLQRYRLRFNTAAGKVSRGNIRNDFFFLNLNTDVGEVKFRTWGMKLQDGVHRPQLLKRKERLSSFKLRSLCLPA